MGPPRLQSNDGSRSQLQPVRKHQPCPTDVDQGLRGRSHIVGAAETPKGNLERRTAERVRDHDGSEASVCRAVRGHRIRRPRGDACSRVGGRIEAGAGILDLDDCSHTNSEEDDDRRAEGQLEQCLSAVDLHRANLCLSRTACARIGRPLPGTMGTSDGTDPPISTCNAVPRSEAQTHSARAGNRSRPRPGKRRVTRRSRLTYPDGDLHRAEHKQEDDRPSEGEFHERGATPASPPRGEVPPGSQSEPHGGGEVHLRFRCNAVTAGNMSTARNGSRTPTAAGSNTWFSARRLWAMSSRRCALRRSAASVRTLCTTPVPYSRPDARMVARLPMAGLSSRSEYSTRRDSKEADPVSWDAMSRRRRSVARSPWTCTATEPSADMALPPPPSSSVNSSSRGASSASIRRRRRAIADLNASTGKPSPETIPAAQRTAAVPTGTNDNVLAPSTAMHAESAIARTVTRSGLSRQPARSRSLASLARRSPTCRARTNVGGAGRGTLPMASMRCEAPPHATNTAMLLSAPAEIDMAMNVGSGIAEPHALQSGQQQQAPHPQIAACHDGEHCEQEGLPRAVVVGVEIGRAQGGERDEEHDGERHDDGGGRTCLHLKRARFALNLLSAAH